MPDSALTPHAAVERLGETSTEVRAAVLLDEQGGLAAQAGADAAAADALRGRARDLLSAADVAAGKSGLGPVGRVEVSRPEGAVFAVRGRDRDGHPWTLVAITAGGALSSLALYDMRMALRSIGAQP